MSLPGDGLSASAVPASLLAPDSAVRADLRVDYEMGGIAFGDPSLGLLVRPWRAWSDGFEVWCAPDDTMAPITHLVSGSDITEVSLCFDQNMRPCLAYVDGGVCKLYWYDTLISAQTTTPFVDATSPMVCMDDKREIASSSGWNDNLFFYLRSGGLYYRQQRERFTVERLLSVVGAESNRIVRVGMGTNGRLQVQLAAAPTVYVDMETDQMYSADASGSVKPMLAGAVDVGRWRSRVYEDNEQGSFAWARVDAAAYPVTLIVISAEGPVATLTVPSDEPMRLPDVRSREWSVEVAGTARVLSVRLAGSLEELEAEDARYL